MFDAARALCNPMSTMGDPHACPHVRGNLYGVWERRVVVYMKYDC